MSKQGGSGEKTEKATPKRLRDAQKKGDVAKSKDLSATLVLAFTLCVLWFTFSTTLKTLLELLSNILDVPDGAFKPTLQLFGAQALSVFISISATLIIPIALFGLLIEFLQTGPVFTLNKMLPKLSHLNPANGIKRMFSMDNAVDVIQSIVKTLVLFLVGYLVLKSFMTELMLLPGAPVNSIALALKTVLSSLMFWTVGIFAAIMLLDWSYQHHAHAKKMRMSIKDIRDEQKDAEGDPMLKNQRKQLHQEFAQSSNENAAGLATVLVVNPTHVAIAIHYDKDKQPVPIISAKGENALAAQMRDAANENHVPVLRNELLARTLLANVDAGELVPKEMFDVVAQIILWATRTTSLLERERGRLPAFTKLEKPPEPPGENLTRYPDGFSEAQLLSNQTSALLTPDA